VEIKINVSACYTDGRGRQIVGADFLGSLGAVADIEIGSTGAAHPKNWHSSNFRKALCFLVTENNCKSTRRYISVLIYFDFTYVFFL